MIRLGNGVVVLVLALAGCGDKGDDSGDGGVDEGSVADGGGSGTDADGDGYSSVESGGDDCDDGNAAVNPGADESCNDRDDDCDGEVDEGFDADGDGYTDAGACTEGTDCDDGDAESYPGADEQPYDGVDQDCDGADLTDVDGDGFDGAEVGGEDCDDADAEVNPDASEQPYDGVDQDCDGVDLTDVDGDGYDAEEVGGADCNDYNEAIGPDVEDEPYDGVDQDCDGADLTDVDGDGYDAVEAGGTDCVDDLASINPGAEEVPYDGVDQDCDGEDLDDVDGDGFAAEEAGGPDCDDEDDSIYPGASDIEGDRVDSDCDGTDGPRPFEPLDEQALDDLPISIHGASGSQDYLGLGVTICDLDDDGLDDIIVTAPLSDGYAGQAGVFLGASSGGWSSGMSMSDADLLISSTGYFMAFKVACADIDGDGFMDLVSDRGEINYTSSISSTFQLLIWYGDSGGFTSDLSDIDADATLDFTLGAESGGTTVYTRTFTTGDVTGDGADDILINMEQGTNGDGSAQNGDDSVWVARGAAYSGSSDLEDALVARIFFDEGAVVQELAVTDDLDGDGVAELVLGQAGYDVDGDGYYEGLLAFISDPSTDDSTISELAWASLVGESDDALAYGATIADLDRDGRPDAVVQSFYDSMGADYAGGLYLFEELEGMLGRGTELPRGDYASGHLYGEDEYSYMGISSWPAGDLDGDGFVDLMVGQLAYDSGGMYYVVDGAALFEEGSVEDALLASFVGSYDSAAGGDGAGISGGVGDFDGDGSADLVMSAYTYLTSDSSGASYYSGRVYIYLGSEAGW